jgi:hypothetical protein
MKCPNRGAERRSEVVALLKARGYNRIHDMTEATPKKFYLEGTGALVLDRVRRTAYVSLSERADLKAAEQCVS